MQTNTLTSRERILAALAHRQPDRVPFSMGFDPPPEMTAVLVEYARQQGLDWKRLTHAVADIIPVATPYAGPPPVPTGGLATEIWGIHTKPVRYGNGVYYEFTDFPLAGVTEIAVLDDYPWPNPAHFDYAGLRRAILRANPERRKAIQVYSGNPLETYTFMTGMEETFVNLVAAPEFVRAALNHITRHFEAKLTAVLDACGELIDVVFFSDDLGGQTGLLMSTAVYRALLQPFHRRLTDIVHRRAPHARCMFHTDGAVFDIVPDLIEAGFDILEAVQTDAAGMDPERLKAAYGERICFHGAISVQQLLPYGDVKTVERACRRLVEILGQNGGYIAAPAHAVQIGTPPENVMAMLRAILREEELEEAIEQARQAR